MRRVYETVQTLLETAPKFDNSFLAEYQDLLISCLRSRHKYILTQSALMWNRTLGSADTLDYSEELQKVLLKLRHVTSLQLPNFPDIGDNEVRY